MNESHNFHIDLIYNFKLWLKKTFLWMGPIRVDKMVPKLANNLK